jgi:chromosomal replication initiation ATPase DnaA
MTDTPFSVTELEAKIDKVLPGMIILRRELDSLIVDMKTFKAIQKDRSGLTQIKIIYRVLESYFQVSPGQMRSKRVNSRKGDTMKARHIFCALLKQKTKFSYAEIGTYIDRDHSTVSNSCKVVQNAKDTNDPLWKHYQLVEKQVNEILDGIT